MKKLKRIKIDRNLCIGAGTCVVLAENTFELDDELIAIIKKSDKKDTDEDILASAKSCPVLAIILAGEDGNQLYP